MQLTNATIDAKSANLSIYFSVFENRYSELIKRDLANFGVAFILIVDGPWHAISHV